MSLQINAEHITGIYALGQWFEVQPGSVIIDAYELCSPEEQISYQLGAAYPATESTKLPVGDKEAPYRYFPSVSGHTGISFVTPDSEVVAFSLMEAKAFKTVV